MLKNGVSDHSYSYMYLISYLRMYVRMLFVNIRISVSVVVKCGVAPFFSLACKEYNVP